MRLIACPSCSQHVRPDDSRCPHCAAPLRTIGAPTTSLVLLGLALAGCPADDYREDLPAVTSESTSPTSSASNSSTSVATSSEGSGTTTIDPTTIGSEAMYGVPETDSLTGTADSSTGTGSSTGSTDGSSTSGTDSSSGTGSEPLYGALDSG